MRAPAALPYDDPFSPAERAVIERALVTAVRAVCDTGELDLRACTEIDLTVRVERTLNLMLEASNPVVPGFSKAIFQTVVRGAELNDHDGASPEKRPDLQFRSLRSHPGHQYPEQCVLLVEAKIVDREHPMNLYGRKGIARFVRGTYAWAVTSAIMLGYARHSYHPAVQLKRHLDRYGSSYSLVGGLVKRQGEPEAFQTLHDRDLPKLPAGERARITLHHIWIAID